MSPLTADAARALAAANAILDSNLDVPLQLPYNAWEEAFIERWKLVPLDEGRYARLYIETERMDWARLNFHEAARAFHVNQFTFDMTNPEQVQLWVDMETDYDRVTPATVKERLDLSTQTKVMKEQERFDPTDWQQTNRTLFDMADRKPFVPYTPPQAPQAPQAPGE